MPHCIFFDLDNTLLDHSRASRRAAETFQRRHASTFAMPLPLFAQRWHHLIELAYGMYARGQMPLADARRWRMVKLFESVDQAIDDAAAESYVQEALADYTEHWRLYPGARAILERLRSRLGGIITNGGAVQQHAKIAQLGLNRFFKHVLIAEEVGCAKPAPAIFRQARQRVGLSPRDCLLIGDAWETDVVGARRAGWQAVWIKGRRLPQQRSRIDGVVAVASLTQAADCLTAITPASTAPFQPQADPFPHRCQW